MPVQGEPVKGCIVPAEPGAERLRLERQREYDRIPAADASGRTGLRDLDGGAYEALFIGVLGLALFLLLALIVVLVVNGRAGDSVHVLDRALSSAAVRQWGSASVS
jgi:hypothetical protein